MEFKDLAGKKFNMLTVIERVNKYGIEKAFNYGLS